MTEKKKRKTTKKKKSARAPTPTTRTHSSRKREKPDAAFEARDFSGPERIHAFASTFASEEFGDQESEEQQLETWVTFNLAGETFALPVTAVQEILRVGKITSVPHAPYTVRGIINMRGRVVPVVDFRVRLSLPEAEIGPKSRILITSTRDHIVGLLVDSVEQVVALDMATVEQPPEDVMTIQSGYIVGVCHHGDKLLFMLDVEPVLRVPDSLEEQNRQLKTKVRKR